MRLLPVAAVLLATAVTTWRTRGSIAAATAFPPGSWAPCAVVAALVLAAVLLSGAATRPERAALASLAGLAGLAAWTALSILWSWVPSGARDETLLVSFYAVSLAAALLLPSGARDRLLALQLTTLVPVGLALAVAGYLLAKGDPNGLYKFKRLAFPISYVNANAALFAAGFWPAVMLTVRRAVPAPVRAAWFSAAATLLAATLLSQSKGSVVALTVSAVAVFALVPRRLRLLVPTVAAVALAAAAFLPLTSPYRASDAARAAAIHHAALAVLVVAAIGYALGLAYALADHRLSLEEPVLRRIRVTVAGLVALAVVAGVAAFLVRVDHPGRYAAQKWRDLGNGGAVDNGGSTHLTSLGSHRFDFWRVASHELATHPVQGIGARGFFSAYLQDRHSDETPLRAHSLYLDELSEEGIVGFGLLALAVLLPLLRLARRLDRVTSAGAFGAAVYLLVHAAVDWLWTFPLLGLLLVLYLSVGLVGDERPPLARRSALAGGVAALVLGLLVFLPPWVAARFTKAATQAAPARAASDLRWARRLDPLSLEPLYERARLAHTVEGKLGSLLEARRLEPRNVATLAELGLVYELGHRRAEAHASYLRALQLDPRDAGLQAAARRTGS